MATPFQLFQNIEKQVGAASAQHEIALAQEPVMLMRYDDDARHGYPLGFHARFY
ncbi:hypothetical protein ACVDG5_005100 [Mesorhizobium sp. ORM6]